MAYFPHAYQKMLIASDATPILSGDSSPMTTLDLSEGQIAAVNAKTHTLIDLAETPNAEMFYLAQGSFYQTDVLGSSLHGGYKETVKSKGINPKYVSAFYLTRSADPVNHVLMVKPNTNCASIACDSTYRLRVDVKGSPALRFLTHNLYQTVDAYSGCCDGSDNNIDPMILLLQWKERINESLILNLFVNATVFNKAVATGTSSNPASSASTTTATWQTPAASGANTALSNLDATTAISQALTAGAATDLTLVSGGAAKNIDLKSTKVRRTDSNTGTSFIEEQYIDSVTLTGSTTVTATSYKATAGSNFMGAHVEYSIVTNAGEVRTGKVFIANKPDGTSSMTDTYTETANSEVTLTVDFSTPDIRLRATNDNAAAATMRLDVKLIRA
jgi:hypothetical protein